MKNKSLFSQVMLIIILGVVCLILTLGVSLLVGSIEKDLFDFRSLNFSNMLSTLLICGFISCVILGICILFVLRTVFRKAKDYFNENNKEKGDIKK